MLILIFVDFFSGCNLKIANESNLNIFKWLSVTYIDVDFSLLKNIT